MSARLRTLVGLVACAAAVAGLFEAGPGSQTPATEKDAPGLAPANPEAVRDVFLLLDGKPLHLRLRITIGGKSPQAVRREYLARLFKSLDADGDGKLTRAEFERSPLNTSRRGPNARPLTEKEAKEVVPATKLTEALERVAGETLAFRQDNTAR